MPHSYSQWLNYSKGGGGTLHFVPFLLFPSLPQSSPSSHPLRSRPAPFQRFWESGGTTTVGGGTAISGGGTPDTGGKTPFRPVPAEFNHWL